MEIKAPIVGHNKIADTQEARLELCATAFDRLMKAI